MRNTQTELKIVYDESKLSTFRSELMNNNEVLQRMTDSVDNCHLDSVVNSFTDFIYATPAVVYGKEIPVKETTDSKCSQNKWFNEQCSEAKLFSCPTQLSMKIFLLINVKMPTVVGILTFRSGENSILDLSEPKISQTS